MMMAHDLLDEPLLSWRDRQRHRGTTTLPGMIAKLASGELADFPRARAHQFHPWSMFLTQLAAIALRRAGKDDPRLSEKDWRSLLLDLTDDAHEPWCVVVEDLSKPAFFQPPVPEKTISQWNIDKGPVTAPDLLDVLATAKNHDVKRHTTYADELELWAYALCTLQTTQAFYGAGNWGIVRKFKGHGARPRVGLSETTEPHTRFIRDVAVILEGWKQVSHDHGFVDEGVALVWVEPWDGTDSLSAERLGPHFIEICRRVRLVETHTGEVVCYTSPTDVARCMHRVIETGDVGDPWIPIRRDGASALNVGGKGLHYALVADVLFEQNYQGSAAQRWRPADHDPSLLIMSALARGEGGTDGLHERLLPIPPRIRVRLGAKDMRDAFGKRAESNILQAEKMKSNVLTPAVLPLALGTRSAKDVTRNVGKEFEAGVDEVFFDLLFASVEQSDDEARLEWDRRVNEIAWAELQRAIDRCCIPSARWYQAVSNAEGVFRACRSKQFPTLVASFEPGSSRGAE